MATLHVTQLRSGEGWILTDFSNVNLDVLANELSDLLSSGILLVASEAFATWKPQGGESLGDRFFAFRGDAARALLRDFSRWSSPRAIFAVVPAMPGDDARRRWIPDPLRPWDPDRLKATVYGQSGKDMAHRGLWFARDRDRERLVEVAITRVLANAGLKLPNGDVALVLEMPTDSTFESKYSITGTGASFAMKRDFPTQMVSRTWTVGRGEWQAEERSIGGREARPMKYRVVQGLANTGIIILAIPTFALMALAAVIAKFSGVASPVSKSAPSRTT